MSATGDGDFAAFRVLGRVVTVGVAVTVLLMASLIVGNGLDEGHSLRCGDVLDTAGGVVERGQSVGTERSLLPPRFTCLVLDDTSGAVVHRLPMPWPHATRALAVLATAWLAAGAVAVALLTRPRRWRLTIRGRPRRRWPSRRGSSWCSARWRTRTPRGWSRRWRWR